MQHTPELQGLDVVQAIMPSATAGPSEPSTPTRTITKLQTQLDNLHKAITIINHLAAELDIQTAMNNVREVVLELLHCEKVTLFLVFDRKQELRGLSRGPTGDFLIRVKFGEGIAGTVAETGELMNIADTYSHPLFNSTVDRSTGFRTRNMLCCAISDMTGKNIAVLQALNKQEGETFSSEDENNLRLFGTHLGNTLAKAKLHETAQRERTRLTSLYTCFKNLSSTDSLNDLLDEARVALHEVLQAQHVFVFVMDQPRNELWTNFQLPGRHELTGARIPMGSGVVGTALEQRVVRLLNADIDTSSNMKRSASSKSLHTRQGLLAQSGGSRVSHSSSGRLISAQAVIPHYHDSGSDDLDPPDDPAFQRDTDSPHPVHSPPLASLPNLLDAQLMRQIAPVLRDDPVLSVLIQPLLGDYEKVVGGLLVINKRETGGQKDILYEDHFTEADTNALALFSLELGQLLDERSLECALASAFSVVGHDGTAKGAHDEQQAGEKEPEDQATDAESELLLRSQLISMYFQGSREIFRRGSENSAPLSPLLSSSNLNRSKTIRRGRHLGPNSFCYSNTQSEGHSPYHDGDRFNGLPMDRLRHDQLRARSVGWSISGTTAIPAVDNLFNLPALVPAASVSHIQSHSRDEHTHCLAPQHSVDSQAPDMYIGAGRNTDDLKLTHITTVSTPEESSPHFSKLSSFSHGPQPFSRSPARSQSQAGIPLHRLSHMGKMSAQGRAHPGPLSPRLTAPDLLMVDTALGDASSPASSTCSPSPGNPQTQGMASPMSTQHLDSLATFYDASSVLSWDFNLLDFALGDLVKLSYDLFLLSGLVDHFSLNKKALRAFLTAVASHHHNIPYHNFNHVCHVLHGVALLIRTETIECTLPKEEQLALLIAAICHDLDHDGCSNAFHINSQSELAYIYNDVSVMENHHCAMTFTILRRKECAFLDGLELETQRRLRKCIVTAILSTDMSQHFAVTQDFKKHALEYEPDCEADRLLLLKVLLHASDIGSAVRPLEVNDVLSKRVHREFQALAEKETAMGLPITFAVDPSNPRMCAQIECNFLDYVVIPLWERLSEVVPELDTCFNRLIDNRHAYQQLLALNATASGTHSSSGAAEGAAAPEGAKKH